jgi:DNA (cytosine-5)-methyltransferase 1
VSKTLYTADLYCGAGGFTAGLHSAASKRGITVQHVAVNHWDVAINTHSANFPDATHFRESMETIDPRKAVPDGHLDLLVCSPECVHHSRARGGRPMSDQSRSTAWHILRWCESLYVDWLILENVHEWMEWGPIYPCTCGAGDTAKDHKEGYNCLRPIESQKGATFRRWVSQLRSLDYVVEFKMLCSANYGGATTRTRFFLQARRIHSKRASKARPKISWPEPSHIKPGTDKLGLWEDAQPWRAAREIIDWSIEGRSIYDRKKPLAPNTMRRIYAGLRKFSGIPFIVGSGGPSGQGEPANIEDPLSTVRSINHRGVVEPFLVVLRNNCDAKALEEPMPTLTANGLHLAVAHPFLLPHQHGNSGENVQSIERPLPTVTGQSSDMFVAQPYLVNMKGKSDAADAGLPLPTQTAHAAHLCVAEPYMIGQQSNAAARSTEEPVPTAATAGAISLVNPCIVPVTHSGGAERAYSVEEPLNTVTGARRGEFALSEPLIVSMGHKGGNGSYVRESTEPLPTVTTQIEHGIVEPYLVAFYGEREGQEPRVASVDDPLQTVCTQRTPLVIEPFMSIFHGGPSGDDRNIFVDLPVPTLDTSNRVAVAEPYLVKFYGTGTAASIDEPVDSITTKDRFALVHPEIVRTGQISADRVIGYLDIRFRMLKVKELGRAMGFEDDYIFAGSAEQQVRQIGNAVSVEVAEALCGHAMDRMLSA